MHTSLLLEYRQNLQSLSEGLCRKVHTIYPHLNKELAQILQPKVPCVMLLSVLPLTLSCMLVQYGVAFQTCNPPFLITMIFANPSRHTVCAPLAGALCRYVAIRRKVLYVLRVHPLGAVTAFLLDSRTPH